MASGATFYETINNNSGVVAGTISGHAHIIGPFTNPSALNQANLLEALKITTTPQKPPQVPLELS